MTGLWRNAPYTFRALKATFGQMWVRCDVCRRYAPLRMQGLLDVDYRTKTFSCSRCGAEAWICVIEPFREAGMNDYRLDPVSSAERHPKAAERLTRARRAQPRIPDDLAGQRRKYFGD